MGNKTILIKQENGDEIQIDIPEEYKITFGPAAPGTAHAKPGGKMPMALRVYESETKQRAVFTDVIWFRDMSIPVRVKQINTQQKDGFTECEGIRKRTTFTAESVSWVNPDETDEPGEPRPQLIMPSDVEVFGRED